MNPLDPVLCRECWKNYGTKFLLPCIEILLLHPCNVLNFVRSNLPKAGQLSQFFCYDSYMLFAGWEEGVTGKCFSSTDRRQLNLQMRNYISPIRQRSTVTPLPDIRTRPLIIAGMLEKHTVSRTPHGLIY